VLMWGLAGRVNVLIRGLDVSPNESFQEQG